MTIAQYQNYLSDSVEKREMLRTMQEIDPEHKNEYTILYMLEDAKLKAKCRVDGRYEIQFDVSVLDRMIGLIQKAIQYDRDTEEAFKEGVKKGERLVLEALNSDDGR